MGQTLRFADESSQFGCDRVWLAVGDGRVQGAQLGGLPGTVSAVQAVEFAQHGSDGLAALFRLVADDDHFHPRAEDLCLLLRHGGTATGGEADGGQADEQVPQAASHASPQACSTAEMKALAASKPDCCRISTMQVGLVTLISVRWSPITSRPTSISPRLNRTGPSASAICRSRPDSSWATPVPPAARLPRVSPAFGMRARHQGTGLPAMSRMRLSPAEISGR